MANPQQINRLLPAVTDSMKGPSSPTSPAPVPAVPEPQPLTSSKQTWLRCTQLPALKSRPLTDLSQTMRRIMLRLGIRPANIPGPEETQTLVEFIRAEYPFHSLEEFELAFLMAMTRKLDLDERDVPCYENFSCEYVARVMTSYNRWCQKQHRDLPAASPAEKPTAPTDQEMRDWMEDYRESIKNCETALELLPLELYHWMADHGILVPTKNEINRDMLLAVDRREAFLLKQDREGTGDKSILAHFNQMKKEGCFLGQEVNILTGLRMRITLFRFLGGYLPENNISKT